MRLLLILLGVVLGALFVRLVTIQPPGTESPSVQKPEPVRQAPDLKFPKLPGGETSLSALRGKVVLLDFWATWCGPCRMSIPEVEALYKKYKDRGLQVIGVSVDDSSTRAMVPQMRRELGMTYPIIFAEDIPDIADKYNSPSIPTLYVIDRKGQIRSRIEGYTPGDTSLEEQVKELINQS
ncbi:MAG TPA: TlpA disulfide reductase family protein [Chthonomonadaceae bacterium]|nr:TlpA disulfide reductase family protein [Chthonomonadaceae bacterium]